MMVNILSCTIISCGSNECGIKRGTALNNPPNIAIIAGIISTLNSNTKGNRKIRLLQDIAHGALGARALEAVRAEAAELQKLLLQLLPQHHLVLVAQAALDLFVHLADHGLDKAVHGVGGEDLFFAAGGGLFEVLRGPFGAGAGHYFVNLTLLGFWIVWPIF